MYVEVSRDVLFVCSTGETHTHIPEVPGNQGVFEGVQTNLIRHVKREQENVIGAKCQKQN